MSKSFTFSGIPDIKHSRSRFNLSHGHKTTFNVGDLVPIEVREVYPGDTITCSMNAVVRLTSQYIRPVMDNLFLDVYWFFVPNRLIFDHWEDIFGEPAPNQWVSPKKYHVPFLNLQGEDRDPGDIADHMGIPYSLQDSDQDTYGFEHDCWISVLPFRAFAKIYDDWFRDENFVEPMLIQTGYKDGDTSFSLAPEALNYGDWSPSNYTGRLPKIAKFSDYFTKCLPAPQKGPAVDIPVQGQGTVNGTLFVGNTPQTQAHIGTYPIRVNSVPNQLSRFAPDSVSDPENYGLYLGSSPAGVVGTVNGNQPLVAHTGPSTTTSGGVAASGTNVSAPTPGAITYSNLIVKKYTLNPGELEAVVDGANFSVNDLRFAFQYQKLLERQAYAGSRYVEQIASMFGVSAGDTRLQRSEFLGGKRTPLNLQQVTQTTGSNSSSSPLGSLGAYSLSRAKGGFNKGIVEHGFIIGVAAVRQQHNYQQGIERFWFRHSEIDFMNPVFSNIGMQPVYKSEIYADGTIKYGNNGTNAILPDYDTFGYRDAWDDLRFGINKVSGQFRTNHPRSLDFWTFTDYYDNAPVLGKQFIEATSSYVDRTITVPHFSQDQFMFDFWFDMRAYRCLPTFGTPSLIDHN